ncbi:Rne/Rng family ribonuclease [Moraxella bovis]|uniref:Rne/Rng family ribonuclease n=1 Tax=Moraxella bovis TaxID=476 RepID=UPI0022271B4C|nr:Rne/Rng family ribonuclease [Moraxella bovis]UYZ71084.1 Rne/Rng family ribonuclease [Moraxella bovis]
MKRILINATHNEEIRVALCKDHHLYDFDLENRTREQKKANIYKGHITRVEPSLEAVFVEYGSARQGFLPLREIAPEYLKGNPRTDNIRDIIKEGDSVIVQVEKEERGNKGAALSTYVSLAGRYLVLMPNNAKAGGISRQISGKVRDEMKQIIASLSIPRGMSVIVRTAGIGKGFDDLQNDLNHLLDAWSSIQEQNRTRPSPCLVHQEAGVVTRAVRDYLRDDIGEVWIDSENAYNEAAHFIASVMPTQMGKLRKYTDYEPLFSRFGVERQIETAYQREVRLPSGGSIVIDQTEAMVAIDINSAKSTKGSDVSETAYHTNLEAADEIARQLRLRDMGGLIVIDFIDMNDPRHQKDVEKRLIDATRYDRARVQFAEISKFGLMEMSRQRLCPSLEEATGYLCPRCHGNGMIRDLRSLALSIMRQIEQIALKERMGEIQAEVPTEIAAFLLNEKRESLVYLEQDSGTRITILPHAHLESPNFSLHFNPDGFAPSSYERIVDVEERENIDRGYEVNWQTPEPATPKGANHWDKTEQKPAPNTQKDKPKAKDTKPIHEPKAVAWLSNLFAPKPQARLAHTLNNEDAAAAIESIVNGGGVSLGSFGTLALPEKEHKEAKADDKTHDKSGDKHHDKTERPARSERDDKYKKKTKRDHSDSDSQNKTDKRENYDKDRNEKTDRRRKEPDYPKREPNSQRESRGEMVRGETLRPADKADMASTDSHQSGKAHDKADKGADKGIDKGMDRSATKPQADEPKPESKHKPRADKSADKPAKADRSTRKSANPDEVVLYISPIIQHEMTGDVVHVSLDNSKPKPKRTRAEKAEPADKPNKDSEVVDLAVQAEVVTETISVDDSVTTPVTTPANNTGVNQKGQATSTQVGGVSANACDMTQQADMPTADVVSAERLTTLAQEMNKAINDPRVVAVALREKLGLTKAQSAPTTTRPTITGTAGEFIQSVLGDTLPQAWRDDFVAHFLRAVDAIHADKPTETHSATDGEQEFEQAFAKQFANYGYAPLSSEYLADFAEHTTAQRAWHIGQGKTKTMPRPIAQRASNDPRGQHPDLGTSPILDETAGESVPSTITDETPTPATETHKPEPVDSPDLPVGDMAEPSTHDTTEPSLLESASDTMDKVLESAESALESLVQALDDIISPTDESKDDDKMSDAKAPKVADKTDDKTNDETTKTSPASYKDMIESVSGQLLQPTGILNLVTPKKPKPAKTKTPKPAKTPAKRTSKAAQKAKVVKRTPKADDNTPLDTPSSDDNQAG